MKLVITADWHMGLVSGGYDYHADIVRAARAVLDTCSAEEADLFVFLGDLYHDSRPTSRSVAQVIELLSELPCPGLFIAGNHDVGSGFVVNPSLNPKEPRLLPTPDTLEPLRAIEWENPQRRFDKYVSSPGFIHADNLGFTGQEGGFLCLPYVTDAMAKFAGVAGPQAWLDAEVERCREDRLEVLAVFAHLDVEGAVLGSERAVMRGKGLMLPEAVRQLPCPVFNGHIHSGQVIGPNIYLPGSLVPTDFSDSDGEPAFVVLEVP